MQLHAHLLPRLTTPEELADGTIVVIDVLRATSVIITALANGAAAVAPCLEVDVARRIAASLPPDTTLLGGERGGLLIEGFDLANSPHEYSAGRVAGKTIVFTTTNGTRAIQQCHLARQVLFGAFVNLTAVCETVRRSEVPIHLLCAGTQDRITREDALLAGAITARLAAEDNSLTVNDEAALVAGAWRDFEQTCPGGHVETGALAATLRKSRGGRNSIGTGNESDIDAVARLDAAPVVPELDLARGQIVLR